MPRVADRAIPPPHPRSSAAAGAVMPHAAGPAAAAEGEFGESIDMVAIEPQGLDAAETIDVDVDEHLFEHNSRVVQPQRHVSGSNDSAEVALQPADTQPQRPLVASATDTLNTPLVASATGTINSSSSADLAALRGIDDLSSTNSRVNVALTEHVRLAKRRHSATKIMALTVLLAGVAVSAIFVPWKMSHGASKTPHDPPHSVSCDLKSGQPPGYEPICHGASHNRTLCLEMNLTCTWNGGPTEPPLSCELKPGQPPGYEALCHARHNESSCLELKLTCTWRRGPHHSGQQSPGLFPRPEPP